MPEVDTGYVPSYTFRTSGGMNVMDPAGKVEMGLSRESGMEAGWLTLMRIVSLYIFALWDGSWLPWYLLLLRICAQPQRQNLNI